MNRIEEKFKTLKKKGAKAFVAFITAGYPDLATTGRLVEEFARRGVDIVELGVPFSDPMADGPVIQEASHAALAKGARLASILALVRSLRKRTDIPLCLMTYYNPVHRFGPERFVRQARASGVDGVIIPDLPPEEAAGVIAPARKYGLATVFFVAPTTTPERMRLINRFSRGFIYYVSLTGVTGARQRLPADLTRNLERLKKIAAQPVCVGFGVSRRAQVRQIQKIADGVIVGSAIVAEIKKQIGRPGLVGRVGAFVSALKG